MAIQSSIKTEFGIDLQDAYVRVENAALPSKDLIVFTAVTYAKANFPPIFKRQYTCQHNLEGENAIKQAYKYLKTLPEFEGAQDC
jgi:hypothetical protein